MDNENVIRLNEVDNIPIFTEQFLEHNKQRETELRSLKKMTTDCEENNAVLQKHIEDINITIGQLEKDIEDKKQTNAILLNQFNSFKANLYEEFHNFPLPGTNECPSEETIDHYMQKLQAIYKPNSNSRDMEIIKQKISNVLNKSKDLVKDYD